MEKRTSFENVPSPEGLTAILPVGGKGERLLPLTAHRPKPLLPLGGTPILFRILRQLYDAGIRHVILTAAYLSSQIREETEAFLKNGGLGDPAANGFKLEIFVEEQPLGTAGSVRAALKALSIKKDRYLLLPGDAYFGSPIPLFGFLRFHTEKGGAASLLLSRSDHPTDFGLAVTGEDGRIRTFREKPLWQQVCTDAVSTGVYLLEHRVIEAIPQGKYDFGHQLFGDLMATGEALYGYLYEGFWCDIGTPDAYRRCDRLARLSDRGKISRQSGRLWGRPFLKKEAAVIHAEGGLRISPAEDRRYLGYQIGEAAKKSFSFDRLPLAILSTAEGRPLQLQLLEGIRDAGVDVCDLGSGNTSLGRFLSARVGFPLILQISYRGAGVFLLSSEPRDFCRRFRIGQGGGSSSLATADNGEKGERNPLSCTQEERPMAFSAVSPEFSPHLDENPIEAAPHLPPYGKDATETPRGRLRSLPGGARLYTEALARQLPPLDGWNISLSGEGHEVLGTVLTLRGATVNDADGTFTRQKNGRRALKLRLLQQGERLEMEEEGYTLTPWECLGACVLLSLREGLRTVVLPEAAPEALKETIRQSGATLRLYGGESGSYRGFGRDYDSDRRLYLQDGAFAAVQLLSHLAKQNLSARELKTMLPAIHIRERETEIRQREKAALLRAFGESAGLSGHRVDSLEGVVRRGDTGILRAICGEGGHLKLMAEAASEADAETLLREAIAFWKKR